MGKSKAKPKDNKKYVIYRIDDTDTDAFSEHFPKKIIMQKFFAENDAEAFKYLKDYRKIANKAYTYYYGEAEEHVIVDENGNKKSYNSVHEMHKEWLKDRNIWEKIKTELDVRWSKIMDGWYWLKYLWYYIRTGHDYRASWSLDSHLLNEIVWNLKILKNDDIGCSPLFLDKARAEIHKGEKDFNIEEYAVKMNYDYTEDEWKLGKKLRADEYDKMLEYVALYDYYSNFGITNKELVDDVEAFENKWKKTLPIKPGTYRDFDYKKLDALADKYWNKIWEWIRTYGKVLWT